MERACFKHVFSVCCSVKISLHWNKWAQSKPWQTAPDHYSSSTKLYSWHYAFGQVAIPWHLPNSDSSVRLPHGEAWFITPENAFPLLESPIAANFTPLQPMLGITHGDLRLVCGCSAMETHFVKLPTNFSLPFCAHVADHFMAEPSFLFIFYFTFI